MKRTYVLALSVLLSLPAGFLAVRAGAGGDDGQGLPKIPSGLKKTIDTVNDFVFTAEERRTLGQDISAKLREKYGVVQDRAVHKYVTLAGQTLAAQTKMADKPWTFVVLDTDGINAFAAPGGFIHITKGALALAQNEAELADILGHEIVHVTADHTINAIRKSKAINLGASATRQQFLEALANKGYELLLENAYDRDDEDHADQEGIALANKAGYAPAGLGAFLGRLAERNKSLTDKSGLFSSHPAVKARIDGLAKTISSQKLTAAALVAARYDQNINFTLVPVGQIAQVAAPTPGDTTQKPANTSGGKGALGLGGLNPLTSGKSGGAVSSSASRGVNPDRDAKGGPNKAAVVVTVTAAELDTFKKGIS
jgi:beta-barrel assembly-enhancing protease